MFPNKMAEQYIENTTRLRGDMKFSLLVLKKYFTSERSEEWNIQEEKFLYLQAAM